MCILIAGDDRMSTMMLGAALRTLDLIANIKRLSGLLPICSCCKRIRSDQNHWEQVESYITEHSDAQFSHGICPAYFDQVAEEFDAAARPSAKSRR
jgi:hypothetical protein